MPDSASAGGCVRAGIALCSLKHLAQLSEVGAGTLLWHEAAGQDALDLPVEVAGPAPACAYAEEQLLLGGRDPWHCPVDQFVEHDAEGPDLGLVVVGFSGQQLGTGVERSPGLVPHHQLLDALRLEGESKVDQLAVALVEHDVGGLEVPVQYPEAQQVVAGPEDLLPQSQGLLLRDLAAEGLEVAPRVELCGDVVVAVGGAGVDDLGDVGVVEPAEDAHFPEEVLLGAGREAVPAHALQGQPHLGPVDLGVRPLPDQFSLRKQVLADLSVRDQFVRHYYQITACAGTLARDRDPSFVNNPPYSRRPAQVWLQASLLPPRSQLQLAFLPRARGRVLLLLLAVISYS